MRDPFIGRRMSARRFAEWMWYEQVEPFGELRADYRAAQVIAMLHNLRVEAKDQKTVEEFLLKFVAPKPRQTWQQQQAAAKMIARIYNAPGVND